MATMHHWHSAHIQIPHLHVQSPHFDWHDLEHPLRAAVAATIAVLVACLAVYAAKGVSHVSVSSFVSSASELSVTPPPLELPGEWRWERSAVTFDHMYSAQESGPLIEGMQRKPR